MQPKIYSSSDHHIRNDLVDRHALSVLERLHDAGHSAYLVGGGVRDLLMRKHPKDFDISTSAKPEEVKELFRNCLLIGRRFRLAHIRFGRKIIEVATFRAGDPEDAELIVQDNVWGTPEEDVMRRDFTINGLFYDPLDHKIIDYVGGFEDLQKHLLRSIGDPIVRFKQDPVRMLRMLKFQARFGFATDPAARQALEECRDEICKSSSARVMEEMLRMLESGSSKSFFHLLQENGFLKILFPRLGEVFESDLKEKVYAYLEAIDTMNSKERYKTLDRAILSSALVFPLLEQKIAEQEEMPNMGHIIEWATQLTDEVLLGSFSHFPRKIRMRAHYILQMQYRLTPLDTRKRPRTRMVKQHDFPLALIFLKVRSSLHPDLLKSYEKWKQIWKR